MTVLGIGIDLVYAPRILSLARRRSFERLALRILSPDEQLDWGAIAVEDVQHRTRYLSVRWAVKEAAYKALHPYIIPTWKELTYRTKLHGKHAKPTLEYAAAGHEPSILSKLHVSVSHDGDFVIAQVLAERMVWS